MNKAKKKKQVAVEPLQEPPGPMLPCEPAAPPVETFEERGCSGRRALSPRSAEKTRVTSLCMEYGERNEICALINRRKQEYYLHAKALKRSMSVPYAVDKTSSQRRARRRSWLSGRQTKSDWLRSEKSTTHVFQNG